VFSVACKQVEVVLHVSYWTCVRILFFVPLCFFSHVSSNFSFDLHVHSVYMQFLRKWLAIFYLMRSNMRYLCYVDAFLWSRLLASLTQSLESSGLDLSQASISVQINLGKRAKRPATAATSSAKVCFSLFFKLFYVMDNYLTHHREFYTQLKQNIVESLGQGSVFLLVTFLIPICFLLMTVTFPILMCFWLMTNHAILR